MWSGRPFGEIWNSEEFRSARRSQTRQTLPVDGNRPVCTRCPFPKMQADHRLKAFDELDRAPRPLRLQARRSLPAYTRHRWWSGQLKRYSLGLLEPLPYDFRQFLLQRLRGQMTHGAIRRWLDWMKSSALSE